MIFYFVHVDNLNEGYNYLRAVVMAYGDISPESPVSLTSGSQQTTQPTTSASSSERTSPQPNTGTHTPSLYDPFEKPRSYPFATPDKETLESIQNVSKAWFQPPSLISRSETPDYRPFSRGEQRSRTPVSPSVSMQAGDIFIGCVHIRMLLDSLSCLIKEGGGT